MKSMMKNLALLSMGLMIYSCNEKISPELQNGNSTTIPTAVVPQEYYFQVENTSKANLNYKLHRTGPNRGASPCKISSTSTDGPLSSEKYTTENISTPAVTMWDSKKFDISCFFEAEELALYYSGFEFKVSASPNTCSHVGYAPFSFYDKIPGSSSTTYTYVNCSDDVAGSAAAAAAAAGDTNYGVASNADCGQYVDTGIPFPAAPTVRSVRSPAEEADLCSFNYADAKCDEGLITINQINVTWVAEIPDDPLTVANEFVAAHAEAIPGPTSTFSCGGSHLNCVKGPLKELSYIYAATSTEVNETSYNEAFSKEYSYSGNYGVNNSNKKYVNFRRNLANPEIDFIDSNFDSILQSFVNPFYVSSFGVTTTAETSYQPLLMDLYSYNYKWLGLNRVVDTATINAQAVINGYTATPYAAEPFLGFGTRKVNPFYTFYCFDEAYEIKGRIRMVVREWDRVFPTATTSLTYISDIGSLASSRQDYAPDLASENPGDPDGYNSYNDVKDWDDFLFMTRDAGAVTNATTWEPTSGFFNPTAFTNGDL